MESEVSVEADARSRAASYWALAIFLTAVGFIDLAGAGAPLFVLGIALLVLGRRRRERTVFVPGLAATLGFLTGAFLVLPLGCTASVWGPSTVLVEGPTRCTTALGFDYVGPSPYSPPYVPALIAGALVGCASWLIARRVATRRARTTPALPT